MRRWTDGKSWSASRVSGSFLTYREMEGKRAGESENGDRFINGTGNGILGSSAASTNNNDADDDEEGLGGYRYKPDGLMKQSFSISTTTTGQKLHLISYFSRSHVASNALAIPTSDPHLMHIRVPKGMYPDTIVEQGPALATPGPLGRSATPLAGQDPNSGHRPGVYTPPSLSSFRKPAPSYSSMPMSWGGPPRYDSDPNALYHYHLQSQSSAPAPPPFSQHSGAAQYAAPPSRLPDYPAMNPPPYARPYVAPSPSPSWHAPPALPLATTLPPTHSFVPRSPYRPREPQPQDIPCEKLGWSEDARALRVLDRAFCT